MVLLQFSMPSLDKGESVSPYVARSLDIIDKCGSPSHLTPIGTIVEGEWDRVMAPVAAERYGSGRQQGASGRALGASRRRAPAPALRMAGTRG